MLIKSEIIMPNVYVLTYDSQYDLCMSFVRMQEFYESPKFRNKYFTLEEFMDYWASEFGNGAFDYTSRWNGFNLPSKAVSKWFDMYFKRRILRDREWEIIEAVDALAIEEAQDGEMPEKYYLIGVHTEVSEEYREEVINHESAHALYYLYPRYKRACNHLLKNLSDTATEKASKKLLSMGYGKNVIKDEMQAYFSTEKEDSSLKELSGRKKFAKILNMYRGLWLEKII